MVAILIGSMQDIQQNMISNWNFDEIVRQKTIMEDGNANIDKNEFDSGNIQHISVSQTHGASSQYNDASRNIGSMKHDSNSSINKDNIIGYNSDTTDKQNKAESNENNMMQNTDITPNYGPLIGTPEFSVSNVTHVHGHPVLRWEVPRLNATDNQSKATNSNKPQYLGTSKGNYQDTEK